MGEDAELREAHGAKAKDPIDVTVVVPCYNVEAYVEQCVQSLLRNNRISLEILCVNDGSRDSTLAKLERLAASDARIRVIDKPNGGYGAAVNRGILEARGRYVAIAEPDDFVAAHMYDELFELARSYGWPDVVKSSYIRVIVDGEGGETYRHNDYFHAIRPKVQPFTLEDQPWLLRYHPSIWSCLYRRAFLEEKDIRFVEAPGAGWVDNPFLVETLSQAGSIVYTDTPYYHYREDLPGSSSVTLPWQTRYERWHQMMDALEASGLEDPRLKEALYVVAFRYVEGVVNKLVDDEEVLEGTRRLFERMDLSLVEGLDTVSPDLRAYAFRLRDEVPPDFDTLAYALSLVRTGLHSLDINGPGFTLDYVRLFLKSHAERKEIAETIED